MNIFTARCWCIWFKATHYTCYTRTLIILFLKENNVCGVHVLLQDIDSDGPEPSDWDKYASEEYEILVAEETANEQLHEGYDTNTHTCKWIFPRKECS